MKRVLTWLPYLGLLTLALVALVRSFGSEGLGLIELPTPPLVEIADLKYESGSATLAGQVLNAADEALPEALVMIDVDGEIVWDYTDGQGRFVLKRVPVGALEVRVVRRKFAPQTFRTSTEIEDVVLRMTAAIAPPPVLPDIEESDFEGEVLAAIAGRGLLDYEIQLIPISGPSEFGAPIPVRATIGADRHFSFPRLLHGAYEVRVLPPWAAGGSWPNLVDPEQALHVHGPASKSGSFALKSGELAGRLIDSGGHPVQGALVRVAPAANPARPWIPIPSGSGGAFVVRDLPPDLYLLQVNAGEASFAETIEVRASSTAQVDVPPLELRRGK